MKRLNRMKKRSLILLQSVLVLLVFLIQPSDVVAAGSYGDPAFTTAITSSTDIDSTTPGTYYIDSVAGILALSSYTNLSRETTNYVFIVTKDIDFNDPDSNPSTNDGVELNPIGGFKGTFKGQTGTETIKNIKIVDDYGFFRWTTETAMIKNIKFEISALSTDDSYAAGLVGSNYGDIDSVDLNIVGNNINLRYDYNALLAGENTGTISNVNVTVNGTVNINDDFCSLFVGSNLVDGVNVGTIQNSKLSIGEVAITSIGDYDGLFIGENYAGNVTDNQLIINKSTINMKGNENALFIGSNSNTANGSVANNSVTVTDATVTLIGGTTAYASRSYGVGLFVGESYGSISNGKVDLNNSTVTIEPGINGGGYFGGFVGYQQDADLTNSYLKITNSSLDITGKYVGGFAGYLMTRDTTAKIENSFVDGNMSLNGNYLGGFIGFHQSDNHAVKLKYDYQLGDIQFGLNDESYVYAGGFASYTDDLYNTSTTLIENSYAVGNYVYQLDANSGTAYIGGFIGENDHSTIQNSFVAGTMTIKGVGDGNYSDEIGGFVGESYYSTIKTSFTTIKATPLEISQSPVDWFVGFNDDYSTYENSYYMSALHGTNGNDQSTVTSGITGLSDLNPTEITAYNLLGILHYDNPTDVTNDAFTYPYNIDKNTTYYPVLKEVTNSNITYVKQSGVALPWMDAVTLDDGTTVSSSTSGSKITSIPLKETYHIELSPDRVITVELGDTAVLPEYKGYKLWGYYKTDLSDEVEVIGTFDTAKLGTYEIIYSLDAFNTQSNQMNHVAETFTIQVVDTTSPVILDKVPIEWVKGVYFDINMYVEIDDLQQTVVTSTLDINKTGAQKIKISAMDLSGNETYFYKTVTVREPITKVDVVKLNVQQLVFVLNEQEIDLNSVVYYYQTYDTVKTLDKKEEWYPITTLTSADENLYIKAMDRYGNEVVRKAYEILDPTNIEVEVSNIKF